VNSPVDTAAEILRSGGVIAYPTEGVFGLGCLPHKVAAVERVLDIKQRNPARGLILIAATPSQLDGWIALPGHSCLPDPDPRNPITWVVPATGRVAPIIRGTRGGVAVRLTTHPVARAIALRARSPLVSTSANSHAQAVVTDQVELRRQFASLVDYIVPGDCGPSSGPSEIRDLATGAVLRPR